MKFRELWHYVVKEWGFVREVKRAIIYIVSKCTTTVLDLQRHDHKSSQQSIALRSCHVHFIDKEQRIRK